MSNAIDLDINYLNTLKEILKKHLPNNAKVWMFGSRVNGKAKKFSDIDIAIDASKEIPSALVTKLSFELEESNLPYKVDLVDLHSIDKSFKELIEKKHVQII